MEEGPGRVRNFGGVDGLEKPPELSVVLGVVRDLGRAVQQPVEDFVPRKPGHDDLEKMGSQGFESCHENWLKVSFQMTYPVPIIFTSNGRGRWLTSSTKLMTFQTKP